MIKFIVTALWAISVAFGIRYLIRMPSLTRARLLEHSAMQAVGLLAPLLVWGDQVLGGEVKQLMTLSLVAIAGILWLSSRVLSARSNKR